MLQRLKMLFILGLVSGILGLMAIAGILFYFAQRVPDFRTLEDYTPKLVTKLYSQEGTPLAEYARERRIYVPIERIPPQVIQAYLAAEDTGFYNHIGFDIKGIIRAALVNIFTNRRQGASTITQQVAKTFLLSSERTYTRKIKELILAYRMEKAFTKDEILDLYLNQIYLGHGSYGVASAALTYFNKPLEDLTVGQRAMLAGLPKAPSGYNPITHPRAARLRRDVVIRRMETEGFITHQEAEDAIERDLELNVRAYPQGEDAPSFSEHVRREILDAYGADGLYEGGLKVLTTLDPKLQANAETAVWNGLRAYDRRHGYRGAYGRISLLAAWQGRIDELFKEHEKVRSFAIPAAVLDIDNKTGLVKIGLPGGRVGYIPFAAMKWARPYIEASKTGPEPQAPSDVVRLGDIVFVNGIDNVPGFKEFKGKPQYYSLEQLPAAQAALVALDVHTGAVRAMVGGFGKDDDFNRAIQAKRQPGSSFKPLVYAYAMTQGMTPASIVLDAPVVIRNNEMDTAWKPKNSSQRVYGPSTLRRGLEKSRNLMTIRMAQDLGIRNIINFAREFGLKENMPANLSTALGASSVSLLELTSAYSVFPNGGTRMEPYFVERIQGADGRLVYKRPDADCIGCAGLVEPTQLPNVKQNGDRLLSPEVAYVMTDMLRGVVENGTGRAAQAVGHPVGGKTGSTNDYVDAWFVGFSPLYAVGVWVGFDSPVTLGKGEYGSKAALPIWTEFFKESLKGYKQREYQVPQGVSFVRIDADTGELPGPETKRTIVEVFVKGPEPQKNGSRSRQIAPIPTGTVGNEAPTQIDPYGIY
ncbi:MAG: penicillin-binding protein [Magnetococcales bacterium]|nr:penicillin-binding protein [Magnetococcales bacterium]